MKHLCNYFIADLETGGYSEKENPILEIAIIIVDQNMKEKERYNNFILPYKDLTITQSALDYTQISKEDLFSKGVDFKQVYRDIRDLAKKYKEGKYNKPVWVGHNWAKFDNKFMKQLFSFNKDDQDNYFEDFCADTLWMSRMKYGHLETDSHNLDSACAKEGIELVDAHSAFADAEATLKLFSKYISIFRNNSSVSSEESEDKYERTYKFEI